MSDRLFLEECCPTLQQKLVQKLIEDPKSDLPEQDFHDFEVGYSLRAEGTVVSIQVRYPFLAEVLRHGSQALLERVWDGLPLKLHVEPECLHVSVDAAALDAASSQRCVDRLSTARTWLLIGPLVDRLRWLRGVAAGASGAAKSAAPGNAVSAAASASAQSEMPKPLALQVRELESCWIISKPDRVLVILSIHIEDEVDVALGRAFCQEFAETNRMPNNFSLPCTFSEPKDPPSDLRSSLPASMPNIGFLTLTLSDQCVLGATDDRLHALARPVMTFRIFFNFHLKHAKSYLHSRLRKRLDTWQQQLNRARKPPRKGAEKRRLVSGKEFVRPEDKVALG